MLNTKNASTAAIGGGRVIVAEDAFDSLTGPSPGVGESVGATSAVPRFSENRRLWGVPHQFTPVADSDTHTQKLNQSIAKAWQQGDPAAWIVARVIFQELRLTIPEYMRLSVIEKTNSLHHVLKPLPERARQGGLRDATYSALLRDWQSIARDVPDTQQTVLAEACARLSRYLLGKDTGTPFGLLRKWALDIGPEIFEERTDITLSNLKKGRHSRSRFLGYSELVAIGQKAGLLPEGHTPLALWDHDSVKPVKAAIWQEARKFHRSKAVTSALMIFESVDVRTVEELHTNATFTLPWAIARSLHQYDLVPWQKVSSAFSALVKSGELNSHTRDTVRAMWRREEAALADEVTFARLLTDGMNASQISVQSVLDAMQVQAHSDIGSPRDLLRFALEHELRYAALPVGVLAFFTGQDADSISQLLDLKRDEIRKTLLRRDRGSSDPHPIRVERDLWSVSLEVLADDSLKERIQNTEWRRRTPNILSDEEAFSLMERIRSIGFEKAEAALSNWVETNFNHVAWRQQSELLRTFPGFSMAAFHEKLMADLAEKSEAVLDMDTIASLAVNKVESILHGDSTSFAGTKARVELYRTRVALGLPIFHENDTRKTPYE